MTDLSDHDLIDMLRDAKSELTSRYRPMLIKCVSQPVADATLERVFERAAQFDRKNNSPLNFVLTSAKELTP